MAIKSTIFKANLQIADIDHGYYADHALTLARHPSETDERMMVRLVAMALQAHELQDTCGGDGTLAFGVTGYNPAFNTGPDVGVRNAYDPKRVAGGSSSGNGAALGARMVSAALGTDTGGSVRIPCAFNGCTSLRPSMGRYPQAGIAPISHTRDTAGPMARAVADLVPMDRAIAGGGAIKPARLQSVRLGVVPYFYEHLAYTTSLPSLNVSLSTGVTITWGTVGTAGWSAKITHPLAYPIECAMFIGAVPPMPPATVEGQLLCQ